MHKHLSFFVAAFLFVAGWCEAREAATGPLAQYVAAKDDSYGWVKRTEGQVLGCKYVELTLTSQTWRGIVWKHQLYVLKPSQINPQSRHALLLIAGGNWREELADPKTELKLPGEAQLLAAAAEQFKTPVAILLHVPQQPIFDGKREDAIIAYTFEEFLRSGDPTWPLLAPMVKSAVRAMDATSEVSKKEWDLDVEKFTVTGASKRGWTTWLTGAVDDRVVAIAPMVIDMLNMSPQIAHQRATFGDLSDEIDDYKERKLDQFIDTPRGKALRQIVDPYEYRQLLRKPKLVILGTNDRYWPLDASSLYWDALEGDKWLVHIPNNGHGLKDYGKIVGGLNALHQQAVSGAAMPKLSWNCAAADKAVSLTISSDPEPSRVRIWAAKAATRDFRDSAWTSSDAIKSGEAFVHKHAIPNDGLFEAILGEAVYHEGMDHEFSLTTLVRIIPPAVDKAAAGK